MDQDRGTRRKEITIQDLQTLLNNESQGGRKSSSAAAPLQRRKRCQYEERVTTLFFGNFKFSDIRTFPWTALCSTPHSIFSFLYTYVYCSIISILKNAFHSKSSTVIYWLFFFIFQDPRVQFCWGELPFKHFFEPLPSLVFRKVLVWNFGSYFRATPKLSIFCQPERNIREPRMRTSSCLQNNPSHRMWKKSVPCREQAGAQSKRGWVEHYVALRMNLFMKTKSGHWNCIPPVQCYGYVEGASDANVPQSADTYSPVTL